MVDMASLAREQVYSAIRAFTCATVAEAEAATKAIIRLVDNALPDDGGCVRCISVPRNSSGLCNTCLDEDAEREGELRYCGYCKSWSSGPCGNGCVWTPDMPTKLNVTDAV